MTSCVLLHTSPRLYYLQRQAMMTHGRKHKTLSPVTRTSSAGWQAPVIVKPRVITRHFVLKENIHLSDKYSCYTVLVENVVPQLPNWFSVHITCCTVAMWNILFPLLWWFSVHTTCCTVAMWNILFHLLWCFSVHITCCTVAMWNILFPLLWWFSVHITCCTREYGRNWGPKAGDAEEWKL
jgi:hypothetical protein